MIVLVIFLLWGISVESSKPLGQNPLNTSRVSNVTDDMTDLDSVLTHNSPLPCPSKKAPEDNYLDTYFVLYTPTNPVEGQKLEPDEDSLSKAEIDMSLDTRFIIHGFLVVFNRSSVLFKIKDKLLENGPCNVIFVNWTASNKPPYTKASYNVGIVAAQTAKVIKYLVAKGLSLEKLHLIGHSLGAHVAGLAGKIVKGIGRITGLDPAGPMFDLSPECAHLTKTDAVFVDVIHSAKSTDLDQSFGTKHKLGYMDLYLNGGNNQPECSRNILKGYEVAAKVCDHGQAYQFFSDSIMNMNRTYSAYLCDSYDDYVKERCSSKTSVRSKMGFPARKETEGEYYLKTPYQFEDLVPT